MVVAASDAVGTYDIDLIGNVNKTDADCTAPNAAATGALLKTSSAVASHDVPSLDPSHCAFPSRHASPSRCVSRSHHSDLDGT